MSQATIQKFFGVTEVESLGFAGILLNGLSAFIEQRSDIFTDAVVEQLMNEHSIGKNMNFKDPSVTTKLSKMQQKMRKLTLSPANVEALAPVDIEVATPEVVPSAAASSLAASMMPDLDLGLDLTGEPPLRAITVEDVVIPVKAPTPEPEEAFIDLVIVPEPEPPVSKEVPTSPDALEPSANKEHAVSSTVSATTESMQVEAQEDIYTEAEAPAPAEEAPLPEPSPTPEEPKKRKRRTKEEMAAETEPTIIASDNLLDQVVEKLRLLHEEHTALQSRFMAVDSERQAYQAQVVTLRAELNQLQRSATISKKNKEFLSSLGIGGD